MDETTTTSLPRVRTYARDLETERKKRGLTTPASTTVATPTPSPAAPTPQPKPATPTTVPHIHVAAPTRVLRPTPTPQPVAKVVTPDPAPTPKPHPTPIPPFHALTKERSVARPIQHTTLHDNAGMEVENDEGGATIITDTKRDRFKLSSSLFASLRAWWTARQEARALKKQPKYVVPEADRRKGIIQRATSQTGKGITDDYAQLREQVLRRKTEPAPAPTPATPPTPETIWTPNTETIFPLLEAPETPVITNVQVTPRIRSTPPPAPVVAPDPEPTPTPVVQPVVVPDVPPPIITPPTPLEEPLVRSTPAPSVPDRSTSPRITPSFFATVWERLLATNLLSVALVLVAIVALTTLGVMQYREAGDTTLSTDTTTNLPPPSPAVSTETIPSPLLVVEVSPLNHQALTAALRPAPDRLQSPITEIQITNNASFISPATLVTTLDPRVNQNLAQSLTSATFGWYEKNQPFIVLTTSDRTAAQGGMLKWEASLPETLAPLFNLGTRTNYSFSDRTINGYDLRTLVSGSDTEQLVYGFANAQTIIIAPNEATFLALIATFTAAP